MNIFNTIMYAIGIAAVVGITVAFVVVKLTSKK
jgi:uncharacterized membrane-anchored protein YhcB (DUF1043 family)